ncbi:hypothetical protein N8E87_05960 [Avibacterium paragallinarum]|uniref:hypothetical protein n=1 Tax=Avibacterium paragallinarum TaxID=728 RepID=UPI0021F7B9B1|nr:hypothetical protein [Avibacterium paragallinarum]UXN37996.1 hypothetical protein N8E87_05960 [Avibacterium paragallinarum]
MSLTQEQDKKHYSKMLENAQNEKEVDEIIEKIDSLLSFETEDTKKSIWNYLYSQYELIPCFESLDNQHFYKLMAYKKQQLATKVQDKKQ